MIAGQPGSSEGFSLIGLSVFLLLLIILGYHLANAKRQLKDQEIKFEAVFLVLLPFNLYFAYALFDQLWTAFREPLFQLHPIRILFYFMALFFLCFDVSTFAMRRSPDKSKDNLAENKN